MIHMAMRYQLPLEWLMAQPDEIVQLIQELDRTEQGADQ